MQSVRAVASLIYNAQYGIFRKTHPVKIASRINLPFIVPKYRPLQNMFKIYLHTFNRKYLSEWRTYLKITPIQGIVIQGLMQQTYKMSKKEINEMKGILLFYVLYGFDDPNIMQDI